MKPKTQFLLLVLLPLLCQGLPQKRKRPIRYRDSEGGTVCDRDLQAKYCDAPYGGDLHTACRYCGLGLACPRVRPSGRKIEDEEVKEEILKRHNSYRSEVRRLERIRGKARCIPELV